MRIFKYFSKELPLFWTDYASLFSNKPKKSINELVFVVLDTETTGFDFKEDRILSIGALKIQGQSISLNKTLDIYLTQEKFNKETVPIHGLLKNGNRTCISELEALKKCLDYIGDAIIVAHHAGFDIAMLNNALKRNGLPKLKNTVLDTVVLYRKTLIKSYLIQHKTNYTLDELAEKFSISKKDRHTALGDAFITAIAFLKIIAKLKKRKTFLLKPS